MAIFTAIATAIVTYATGAAVVAGTWAAFAVSVIATGLAAATARLIGGPGARGGSGTQDQGVRIQLPPATENKIPIIYGRAFQQPIITDARISSSGGTTQDIMTYVLTLSEYTQTGSFTCNDVYWNDQKLVFDTDGLTVISSITSDGEPSTNLANLVKVYMFAGGSGSSFNIPISGGATPGVNAYDIIPEVTSDYLMSDLVFAVVQLTYSSEKGVTSLPTMTFDITNSLSNPGDVWLDYMTSTRYGAGLQLGDLNEDSAVGAEPTSLKNVSDEIPPNQFNNDSTTSTQARYVINGVLNTGDTVKNNIERINMASSSWTTFDHKLGRWTIVVNRAATNTEILDAKHYNDDNIIGEISLTSTNLEDLYNGIEVAFANRNARDQSDYYKSTIDPSLRNDLEPDNTLRMRLDLCNNKIHAGRVGQIELRQSRYDLLITFTADYTALETEVGDIIKVSNPIYDFDEKLFRVTRVRETEGEDGALAAEITALQYDISVYTDTTLEDAADKPNTNIPPIGSNQYIPPPGIVTVINSQPNVNSPNFTLQTTLATTSTLLTVVEWYYSTNGTNYNYLTNERAAGGFSAGSTVTDIIYTLGQGSYYFRARVGSGAIFSDLGNTSTQFIWNPVGTINSQTVITTGSFTWALLGDKTGALGPTAIGLGQNAGGTQTNTIAIGAQAGQTVQRANSIAIGYQAGNLNQGLALTGTGNSIAIGREAGRDNQLNGSIAIGYSAGEEAQNDKAVAIGFEAGNYFHGCSSVAIGEQSGYNRQDRYAVAIGRTSGWSLQGEASVAIGWESGYLRQGAFSIALGYYSGKTDQDDFAIAIGNNAAESGQLSYAVAIGQQSGWRDQQNRATAIGLESGYDTQGADSIAMGYKSGRESQGANSIAIGKESGQTSQGTYSISKGYQSGQNYQGDYSTAIGYQSGQNYQGDYSTAIGYQAQQLAQGDYNLALGYQAGKIEQVANSIILSAGVNSLQTATNAGFYVNPVRASTSTQMLYFNTLTKEITYGAPIVGPAGATGPQGPQGPIGATGPAGSGITQAQAEDIAIVFAVALG